ncbi:MAG: hypothetical protein LUE96_07435 [Lachnospiraceae bacterium]|nr:hypothetical protein [Lachnospiraceae bacterium]
MTAVKERIYGAVSVMSDTDAETVWGLIMDNFPKRSWEDIPEAMPDEWDVKMLDSIKNDPDCRTFISAEDAMKELGL